ncbi:MAG: hypothetical protein QG629_327 [Patescibacteria group bacterium]|nr:hypothetical protein [Candidatus Saccharibacteria bacterium]MDQ5963245.1 hypothetical protein [Patescibacteria group bacterium]
MSSTPSPEFDPTMFGPENPASAVEATVGTFDASERYFFAACGDFFASPTKSNTRQLENATSEYCSDFADCVVVLGSESSLEQLTPVYSGLIRTTYKRRADYLNIITDKSIIEPVGDEFSIYLADGDGDPITTTDPASIEAYVGYVTSVNTQFVAEDVVTFVGTALESTRARQLQSLRAAKSHGIEIAKFAAGAFIGTWLARKLS